MENQIRVMTSKIRKENWIKIIEERNRSSLSVKEWCFQNHINETSYYYWLKKIRAYMINESSEQETAFVPLIPIKQKKICTVDSPDDKAAAMIVIKSGDVIIELGNNATEEMILNLVRVLKNA